MRPARRSSMEGEAEYAFWHVLTRDVAYAQLPRASRAARHVAAAAWIESQGPRPCRGPRRRPRLPLRDRPGARPRRRPDRQAATLEVPALRFLTLAGERALGLDTAAALANFERALALTPQGHAERAEALARFAEAALHAGRTSDASAALEEAIPALQALGDLPAQARAMNMLSIVLGAARRSALGGVAGPGVRTAGATPARRRPGRCAHRGGRLGDASWQARSQRSTWPAARWGSRRSSASSHRRARSDTSGRHAWHLGDPAGARGYARGDRARHQAGQGREVGDPPQQPRPRAYGSYEGPQAAVTELDTGIAYATARGLTETAELTTASSTQPELRHRRTGRGVHRRGRVHPSVHSDAGRPWSRFEASRRASTRSAASRRSLPTTLIGLKRPLASIGASESLVFGLGSTATAHAALANVNARCRTSRQTRSRVQRRRQLLLHRPTSRRSSAPLSPAMRGHRPAPSPRASSPALRMRTTPSTTAARPRRSTRRPPSRRGRLHRRRRALGTVRRHPRTRLRPPGPRPLPHQSWPTTRSCADSPPGPSTVRSAGAIPALAETDTLLAQATALSS